MLQMSLNWLDKTDLDGLPDTVVEAAKLAAKEKGELDKWLITGHFPSFSPFSNIPLEEI